MFIFFLRHFKKRLLIIDKMLYNNFISRLLKSIRIKELIHQRFVDKEIEFIIYKNGSYIQNEIIFPFFFFIL